MRFPQQLFVWLLLPLATAARAQFYAPDTEYHDVSQRFFPVECVRVAIALQNALGKSSLSGEIVPELKVTPASHAWRIVLRGETGESVQTFAIEYPNSLLTSGAKYYRDIAHQVAAQLKLGPLPASAQLADEYWRGSAQSQTSREASLTNAFRLSSSLTSDNFSSVAPQMAGLLAHTALPGQAGQVTLDGLLLARAATWLALSEATVNERSDALWTSILFQSGRYPAAERAWKARLPQWTNQPFVRGWDTWLSRPSSQAIYLAACDRGARPLGVAMMLFDASRDGTWSLLEDLLPSIVSDRAGQLGLHNYAPLIAAHGTIGHAHQVAVAPLLQRMDWLRVLEMSVPETEPTGLEETIASASKSLRLSLSGQRPEEPATAGLEAVTPLLLAAEKDSVGPLRPTLIATRRDLLCYGWEMGGWQLGARFRFLDQRYGSREDSRPVKSASLRAVEGWAPFFETSTVQQPGRAGAMHRLQFVTEMPSFAGQAIHPYSGTANQRDTEAASTFVGRCWLQSRYVGWVVSRLATAKLDAQIVPTLKRMLSEGGLLQADPVLDYLATRNSSALQQHAGLFELRKQLAQEARQPNLITVRVLYDDLVSGKDGLLRAQEMERLFWRNPDSGLEDRVFRAYASDGRAKEAKRFYHRVRPQLGDSVKVSNGIGQNAWMLGYCTGDREFRRAALADSQSGSMADLQMNVFEAATSADPVGFKATVTEIIQRYPDSRSTEAWRRILGFAKYLPALADKKHSDRERALDYFGRDSLAVVLRWIWIRHYKLPKEDAIRFLGGREVDYVRKVLALALEGNIKGADSALCDVNAPKTGINAQTIMAYWAFHELHGVPNTVSEDVMPASARFTRDAVNERLERSK